MMNRLESTAISRKWTWLTVFAVFVVLVAISRMVPPVKSPDEGNHLGRGGMLAQGQWLLNRDVVPNKNGPLQEATFASAWNGEADADLFAFVCINIERLALVRQTVSSGKPVSKAITDFFNSPLQEQRDYVQRTLCPQDTNGVLQHTNSGGAIDQSLPKFLSFHEFNLSPSLEERNYFAELRWSGRNEFMPVPGTGFYNPVVYAPHAAGWYFASQFNLSIATGYELVRVLTIFVSLLLLLQAFILWRPNPLVIALLLLPMSMFQMVCPGIDGLCNGLAVLAMSLFLRRVNSPRPEKDRLDAIVLVVTLIVLCTVRIHLVSLLMLPFFLAWQRRSWREYALGLLAILAVTAWTLYVIQNNVDVRRTHNSIGELIPYYFYSPTAFAKVLTATLADGSIREFYWRSFIGILGALNIAMPDWAYAVLAPMLVVCAAMAWVSKSLKRDYCVRVLLIAGAFISCLIVFLALLLQWTPHPATVIEGVQGRYFLIPAIMLAYALSGTGSPYRGRLGFIRVVSVVIFGLTSVVALLTTLDVRFGS